MNASNIWLLATGLLAVIVMVVLTASTKRTIAIGTLLALIPFQVVDSRYGTSSELMAYAMAGTIVFMGGLKVRMLPAIGLILLAYFASLTQAERYFSWHVIEIFEFTSCLVVFLLAYNFARLVESERSVMDLLLGINFLVAFYCGLQLLAGAGEAFTPFGIDLLAFNSNRDPSDPRLVGPFDNPGTTAGYFTLMTILCATELIFASAGRRRLLQGLIFVNLAGVIATGNRASFLVMLAAFPVLLFASRRELGARRFIQYALGGVAALVIASATIAVYSDFGHMYDRLDKVTETEEGMPTTRAGIWPIVIAKIKRHPWFGDGPHYFREEDAAIMRVMRAEFEDLGDVVTIYDPYPHSLYLFLLRTVGVFGLAAVLWFFCRVGLELRRSLRSGGRTEYERAILKVGIVVIGAFLVTQITLEFNRTSTMDYAQFIFALMGLLVGVADRNSGFDADTVVASRLGSPSRRLLRGP